MEAFLPDLVRALLIPGVGLLYVFGLWKLFDWWTKDLDDWNELFVKNNVALLLQRGSILIAQLIGMSAAYANFDVTHPWISAGWFALNSLWVFVALVAAYFFVDWVVFPDKKNIELLKENNIAVGIVEAGFFIGIGNLLRGSLTGGAATLWESILSTVVFYGLGLIVVFLVYRIHILVTRKQYDLRAKLRHEGDKAAAIELAGIVVGVSLVTKIAVAGTLYSWTEAFVWFAGTVAASLVLLYGFRWLINRFLFGRHTVKEAQKNGATVAAAFQALIMLFAAYAVTAVMSVITFV